RRSWPRDLPTFPYTTLFRSGSNACGTTQNWCVTDISGAWFNDRWKTFRNWGQLALGFATPSQTLTAGSPSGTINVQLQASGTPQDRKSTRLNSSHQIISYAV